MINYSLISFKRFAKMIEYSSLPILFKWPIFAKSLGLLQSDKESSLKYKIPFIPEILLIKLNNSTLFKYWSPHNPMAVKFHFKCKK